MNASLESLVALETHDRAMHDARDAHAGDVDVVCGDAEGDPRARAGACRARRGGGSGARPGGLGPLRVLRVSRG